MGLVYEHLERASDALAYYRKVCEWSFCPRYVPCFHIRWQALLYGARLDPRLPAPFTRVAMLSSPVPEHSQAAPDADHAAAW